MIGRIIKSIKYFFCHMFLRKREFQSADMTHRLKGGIPRPCDWRTSKREHWIWEKSERVVKV